MNPKFIYPTKDKVFKTSVHEVGHVITARNLKLPIRIVTVIPSLTDDDSITSGILSGGKTGIEFTDDTLIFDLLLLSVSGVASYQTILRREQTFDEMSVDKYTFFNYIREHTPNVIIDQEKYELMWNTLLSHMSSYFSTIREEVLKLSLELYNRKTMTGEEIEEFLRVNNLLQEIPEDFSDRYLMNVTTKLESV